MEVSDGTHLAPQDCDFPGDINSVSDGHVNSRTNAVLCLSDDSDTSNVEKWAVRVGRSTTVDWRTSDDERGEDEE